MLEEFTNNMYSTELQIVLSLFPESPRETKLFLRNKEVNKAEISRNYVIIRAFWKKKLNFSKSSFSVDVNLLHPQLSLSLFALESPFSVFLP